MRGFKIVFLFVLMVGVFLVAGSFISTNLFPTTVTADGGPQLGPGDSSPQAIAQEYLVGKNGFKMFYLEGKNLSGENSLLTSEQFNFNILSQPTHGSLFGDAPELMYVPQPGFEGIDSFTFSVSLNGIESAPVQIRFLVRTWDAPIGIPAPKFGLNEVAGPTTITITGSWTGNHYELHPGDVIELTPGVHDVSVRIYGGGTPSNPVFIRGASPTNMPVINGSMELRGAKNVIIENLDFNGSVKSALTFTTEATSVNNAQESYNVSIRNVIIRNRGQNHSSGIAITPSFNASVHDFVVYNNFIHDLGNWTSTEDEDFHCIGPGIFGRDNTSLIYNIWILDSEMFHCSGNSVQVSSNWASQNYLHHIYLGRNRGHHNRQAAFWSKQASHVIMSENEAYGDRGYGGQGGGGIGYQYAPDNLWIIYNRLHDNVEGIRQSDSGSVMTNYSAYIIGNTIYDTVQQDGAAGDGTMSWGWAMYFRAGNMFRYVVGNTIYNTNGGIIFVQNGSAYVYDNLIHDLKFTEFVNGTYNHTYLTVNTPVAQLNATLNNNIFSYSNGQPVLGWKNIKYNSLSAFQTASGQCLNCTTSNPLFADESSYDLRLQSISPAIDMGIETDVYQRFYDLYGIDIRKDRNGISRPQDGNGDGNFEWDIGAYEFSAMCSDGETQNCPLQIGVCSGSLQICSNRIWPGCSYDDYLDYNMNYEVSETRCGDGLDNDCDGFVDGEDSACSFTGGNCFDNVQNGDETGVDCGGSCVVCSGLEGKGGGGGNSGSANLPPTQNNSGSEINGTACVPSWSCSEWGPCDAGLQSRICRDVHECSSESASTQKRDCSAMENKNVSFESGSDLGGSLDHANKFIGDFVKRRSLLFFIILICALAGLVLILRYVLRRRKNGLTTAKNK